MRLCVFAHFDRDDVIDPYVIYYLSELKRVCTRLIFVSTSQLGPPELRKLDGLADQIIIKENVGYDFGSWQAGLRAANWSDVSEIVLCNDSCYGPLSPFADVFAKMDLIEADFWGITSSRELEDHIQSYFVVYRKSAFSSEAFEIFWDGVSSKASKLEVIQSFEIGLSLALRKAGLSSSSYYVAPSCSMLRVFAIFFKNISIHVLRSFFLVFLPWHGRSKRFRSMNFKIFNLSRLFALNPTHKLWRDLAAGGSPLVKVDLLRTNPANLDLSDLPALITIKSAEVLRLIENHLARMKQPRT